MSLPLDCCPSKLDPAAELLDALQRGEFLVYYQPLVSPEGEIYGVEALMRRRLADGTLVSPATFIPLAEQTGAIVELGDYVLRTALNQLKVFDTAGLPELYASVNVSPRQFHHPDFEARLTRALVTADMAPHRLVLEITEGLLLEHHPETQKLLERLAASGVRLSLDDFGTGYSNLAYLKRHPISTLKADRSFIMDIETNKVSRAIMAAMTALAHELGLKVVAEGVETPGQAEALQTLRVDRLQGYLFGRPMPAEELMERFTVPA